MNMKPNNTPNDGFPRRKQTTSSTSIPTPPPQGSSTRGVYPSLSPAPWFPQPAQPLDPGQMHNPQPPPFLPPNYPPHGLPAQYVQRGQYPPLQIRPYNPGINPTFHEGAPYIPPSPMSPSTSYGPGPSTSYGPTPSTSFGPAPMAQPMTPTYASSSETTDQTDLERAIDEDKRARNTAASARFRIKKKKKTVNLERSVSDLTGRADELEREAADLRRENSWLKEIVILKSSQRVRSYPSQSSEQARAGEGTSQSNEAEGSGGAERTGGQSSDSDESSDNVAVHGSSGNVKGKGKERRM